MPTDFLSLRLRRPPPPRCAGGFPPRFPVCWKPTRSTRVSSASSFCFPARISAPSTASAPIWCGRTFSSSAFPPDFRILDESEISVLRAEAAEETLEEFYERDDPVFYDFVESFASGRDDAAIAGTVGQLYDFVRSHPFPKRWLTEKAALYDAPASAAQTVWGKTILSFAEDAVDYCICADKGFPCADGRRRSAFRRLRRCVPFRSGGAGCAARCRVAGKDWDRAACAFRKFSAGKN